MDGRDGREVPLGSGAIFRSIMTSGDEERARK